MAPVLQNSGWVSLTHGLSPPSTSLLLPSRARKRSTLTYLSPWAHFLPFFVLVSSSARKNSNRILGCALGQHQMLSIMLSDVSNDVSYCHHYSCVTTHGLDLLPQWRQEKSFPVSSHSLESLPPNCQRWLPTF